MRRVFNLYFIFSVVFYAQRYLFGWGAPGVTPGSETPAPAFAKISKDIVWFAFLASSFLLGTNTSINLSRNTVRKNWPFFAILTIWCIWMWTCALFQIIFHQTSEADTVLYLIRYPLEYVPIAFLMASYIDVDRLRKSFLLAIVISTAFLVIELMGVRPSLFLFRYGSIFGSPNDFGAFCAIAIAGVLVYATKKRHWILFLVLFVSLVLTLSRSAMLGMLAGFLILLGHKNVRRALLYLTICFILLSVCIVVDSTTDSPLPLAAYAIDHIGTADESASMRVEELNKFLSIFDGQDLLPFAVGTRYFHVENWYMALLIRSGVIGLVLFLLILFLTIRQGLKYREHKPHAVALAAVTIISVQSLFIPSPDVFPTNLYFWIAVGIVWCSPDTFKIRYEDSKSALN